MPFATARADKHQAKHAQPMISPWPFVGFFGGVLALALCLVMIPNTSRGELAHQYHLPEIAGILTFLVVGRSRSAIALLLCLLTLPTMQACLLFGPSGCLHWVYDTAELFTRTLGM